MNQDSSSDFVDVQDPTPLDGGIVLKRFGGVALTNVPHVVVHHSPTGFEFGYGGSGPADLALNIAEVFLQRMGYKGERMQCYDGDCFSLSWALHQHLKWRFISNAKEGDVIPCEEIESWITAHLEVNQ